MRFRKAKLAVFLLLSFNASSCQEPGPIGQKYVLEMVYENLFFFIGIQQRGMFITEDGMVYSYNRDYNPYITPINGIYSESALANKYAPNQHFLGQVDPVKLRSVFSLFPAAQRGAITDTIHFGFQIGTYYFNGFKYDAGKQVYDAFLLWETGDRETANRSVEAQTIVNFMLDTAVLFGYPVPATLF